MINSLTRLPTLTTVVTPEYEIKRWHPATTTTVTTYTAVAIGTGVRVKSNTEVSTGAIVVNTPTGTVVFPAVVDPSTLVATTTTQTVPGYYTTELVPATTTQVLIPQPGWVGSAVSGSTFHTGVFDFQVDPAARGVVCGLNYTYQAGINSGYLDIPFAFFCTRGTWQVIEKGALKTTPAAFTAGTTFSIESTSTGVHYYVNGVKVYAHSEVTGFELQADASLYLTGDAIYNAVLTSTDPAPIVLHPTASLDGAGDIAATPKPTADLVGSGGVVVNFYAQDLDSYSLPVTLDGSGDLIHNQQYAPSTEIAGASSVSAIGHFVNTLYGEFTGLSGTLIHGLNYAEIKSSFPSLEASMGNSGLAVDFSGVYGFLGGLFSDIYTTSSQSGQISGAFTKLTATLGNGNHAEINGAFPGLTGYAGQFARIDDYSGVCAVFGNGYSGSGTLLWNGQAIITAAHIAAHFVNNPYDIQLKFKSTLDLPRYWVEKVILHPDYTNNGAGVVTNDIAILVLQTSVDGRIARYDVNTAPVELGAVFTRYGYSPAISPMTGAVQFPVTWEWHYITNVYEVFASYDTTASVSLSTSPGPFLAYDYDDGTVYRDVIGGTMGLGNRGIAGEGGMRPGDSGSASFINGKIAGIATAAVSAPPYDVNTVGDGTYGELDLDTRVFDFASWIQTTVGTYTQVIPHVMQGSLFEFTLEAIGYEVAGNTAALPLFTLDASSAGGAYLESAALFDLSLSATGTKLDAGAAEIALFSASLSATGTVLGSGTAALPFISSTVTALGGARAALSAPVFSAAGTGTTAGDGVAALPFLSWSISAAGTKVETGTATLALFELTSSWASANLPLFNLSAVGSGSTFVANAVAYVMNVHTNESTTYTAFDFLHIITIGGKPYGVKSDGLYLLEGDTDNGLEINGKFVTKETDFGDFKSKNVPFVYLNSDTDTLITTTVDGTEIATVSSTFGGRKGKLARGAKGRYWKLTIENVKSMQGLEFLPEELSRRVK